MLKIYQQIHHRITDNGETLSHFPISAYRNYVNKVITIYGECKHGNLLNLEYFTNYKAVISLFRSK